MMKKRNSFLPKSGQEQAGASEGAMKEESAVSNKQIPIEETAKLLSIPEHIIREVLIRKTPSDAAIERFAQSAAAGTGQAGAEA